VLSPRDKLYAVSVGPGGVVSIEVSEAVPLPAGVL
jgi:hypothetical protein